MCPISPNAEQEEPLMEPRKLETATILGTQVELDDSNWNYVMVFPLVTDKTKEDYGAKYVHPVRDARKIFTKRVWEEKKDEEEADFLACGDIFKQEMTKSEYHQKVREKVVQLLCSKHLGLKVGTQVTVDKDELFIKIALENDQTLHVLAEHADLPMPLKEEVYDTLEQNDEDLDGIRDDEFEEGAHKCPTTVYAGGKFRGNQYAPAYIQYAESLQDKLQAFREVDKMHVSLWRIQEFIKIDQLINQEIMIQMFPVHRHTELQKLHETGWSNPWGILTCDWYRPTGTMDRVRDYYGEEVAFFFHWLLFYTRYLVPVSMLSFIVYFRRYEYFQFTLEQQRYIAIAFAGVMLLWSAIFVERYEQESASKITQWGMAKWTAIAPVRAEFELKKRGTYKEFFQNSFHWFLVTLFVGETIGVTAWICQLRLDIKANPDELYFGLDHATASKLGKYLITVNIQIVARIWTYISPKLTGWENHKTKQELKSSMVLKVFIVKAVVYFYPFLYIAFIKKYFEGCGLSSEDEGCIPELNENLMVFFATHIAFVLGMILFNVCSTKWSIMSEIAAVKENNKDNKHFRETYSYLELQSKCPQYLDDTDDFMELIMSLAFVMMFSAALPLMAWLAFVCNLIEMKLLAWRMVHVNQRPVPEGQHGIGIWSEIIKAMCLLSILCNVGLVVFAMHPVEDFDRTTKLLIFIVAQNIAMGFKQVIQYSYQKRGVNLVRIDEVNELVVDELLGGQDGNMKVSRTSAPEDASMMSAPAETP